MLSGVKDELQRIHDIGAVIRRYMRQFGRATSQRGRF